MSKFLILITILFLLTGCGGGDLLNKIVINDNEISVEVVLTPEDMSKGLSGRYNLCDDCGMLFEYEDYNIRNFHMKEMKFPLDIIWIRNSQIVGFEADVQISTSLGQITQVQSPEPINRVLEVNSGWVVENRVKIGDMIEGVD